MGETILIVMAFLIGVALGQNSRMRERMQKLETKAIDD